ncbi:urea transporter [Streptomyces sp. NPDC004111]|uniref:urea transporter n=1 Tax=Streptomyces sp. NPDC004111 TaxID=3364690 RepID=UPI0036B46283
MSTTRWHSDRARAAGGLGTSGLGARGPGARGWTDLVLRGASQVLLQNNPLCGAVVLLALAVVSWQTALFFLVGCTGACAVALLFAADQTLVRSGVFGFVGGLAGILFEVLRSSAPEHCVPALALAFLGGVVLAVPLVAGCSWLLARAGLLPLAFPVVIVFWAMTAAAFHRDLGSLASVPPIGPEPGHGADPFTAGTALRGFGNAFAQIFLRADPAFGFLILLALLVSSRVSTALAASAAALSVTTSWVLGHNAALVESGALAYNAVLTAVALGGILLALSPASVAYALVGSLLTGWVHIALSALLGPIGLSVATLPFVLVTWTMVLGSHHLKALEPLPLDRLGERKRRGAGPVRDGLRRSRG